MLDKLTNELDKYLSKQKRDSLKQHMKNTDRTAEDIWKIITTNCSYLFIDEEKPLANVAIKIGEALDDSLEVKQAMSLGMRLLEFLQINGYVDYSKQQTTFKIGSQVARGDQYQVFTKEGDYLYYMDKYKRQERVHAITTKPDPWTKPFNKGVPIIKKLDPANGYDYTIDKIPNRYKSLNALQSTEWQINERMLEFFNENLPKFTPAEPHELSKAEMNLAIACRLVPEGETEDEAKRAIYNLKQAYKKEYVSAKSKFFEFTECMRIAKDVIGQTLYFQHNMDFRGRAYPLAPFLNPQGSDVAKSLLRFSNPVIFNEKWVFVDIANKAGQDKLSFDDRVKWVRQHIDSIMEVGRDPHSDLAKEFYNKIELHKERKSKFQFIATCIELYEFQETGEWCLPTGMDGTNQGSQFITAIARCENVAEHVNLEQCKTRVVGDLYQVAGDALIVNPKLDLKKAPMLEGVQQGNKMLRKLAKRGCMTYYYSCGPGTMSQNVWEDREDYCPNMAYGQQSHIGYRLYESLEAISPRGAAIMKAMQATVKGNTELTMKWTTPDGFVVRQLNNKIKSVQHEVLTNKYGYIKPRFNIYLDKPDNNKHKLGIAANFIHSLDACMLAKTVCMLADDGVKDFQMIHDQYSVAPHYVDKLHAYARTAFYDICLDDPMVAGLPNYKETDKGNFDLSNVLTSQYFMC